MIGKFNFNLGDGLCMWFIKVNFYYFYFWEIYEFVFIIVGCVIFNEC